MQVKVHLIKKLGSVLLIALMFTSSGISEESIVSDISTATDSIGSEVTGALSDIDSGITSVLDDTGISAGLDSWASISSWWAGIQSLSGLTSINGLVGDFIGSLSGISSSVDGIFEQFNLDGIQSNISSINGLMQCFGTGFDMSGLNLDGICASLEKGNGLGGFSTCLASGGGLDLSSLCGSGDFVNLDTGEISDGSGGGNIVANNNLLLDAGSLSAVATVTLDTVTDGSKTAKKIENVTYPSGVKGEYVFGGVDGGAINKRANKIPSSAEANAIENQDVATLYLSELAIMQKGKNMKGSDIRLASTKKELINDIASNAQTIANGTQDFDGMMGFLIQKTQPALVALEAETLTDYELQEGIKYREIVKALPEYLQLSTQNDKITKMKYAPQLLLLMDRDDYIFDPTEATASKVVKSARTKYRFKSFIQIARRTEVMNKMAIEMTVNRHLKETMVRRGRYGASIFRSDLALKEIDALLKAVDQTIR